MQGTHNVILQGLTITSLTEAIIARNCMNGIYPDQMAGQQISPKQIEVDLGIFSGHKSSPAFPEVTLSQDAESLFLSCECEAVGDKLCEHQAAVLMALLQRDELRAFFDRELRDKLVRKFATDYGLEQEPDLDSFFAIELSNKKIQVTAKSSQLLPINKESLDKLKAVIVPDADPPAYRRR